MLNGVMFKCSFKIIQIYCFVSWWWDKFWSVWRKTYSFHWL